MENEVTVMTYKIVADSSCNVLTMEDPNFASVPMKVRAAKEYIDDTNLDLAGMVEDLRNHKGTSGSACPSVGEWLDAFGDADMVFCTTMSKGLSGSYNAACEAARMYMEENPGKQAYVFNTLTAGPQQAFLNEKILELAAQGLDFETIKERTLEYFRNTHILFCLESMMNLARNGRTSMAVAKIAGMLGIRVCGDVKAGMITPVHKPRGARKATETLVEMMKERGFYDGAQLRIAHCFGEAQALALRDAVLAEFPNTRFTLEPTTALCSFYAEAGGLMIGFEGGHNVENDPEKF
ncbi:MAG: DegV family protein [Oscillospiraceae bacterium]|nr:DegV family protein [Oscillospiraceae bacterium]